MQAPTYETPAARACARQGVFSHEALRVPQIWGMCLRARKRHLARTSRIKLHLIDVKTHFRVIFARLHFSGIRPAKPYDFSKNSPVLGFSGTRRRELIRH